MKNKKKEIGKKSGFPFKKPQETETPVRMTDSEEKGEKVMKMLKKA